MDQAPQQVTQILDAIVAGDSQAAQQLLPLVYNELRHLAAAKLAREAPGQTLQPPALVHEAWLRLVGASSVHFGTVVRISLRADGSDASDSGGTRPPLSTEADSNDPQSARPESLAAKFASILGNSRRWAVKSDAQRTR